MKKGVHPEYKEVEVQCTCGATFSVLSIRDKLETEVCSQCHPFFTGSRRFIDSSGRVDKFQKRFAGWDAQKALEKNDKSK